MDIRQAAILSALLTLGFWVFECPASSAKENDLELLVQQYQTLESEGKYQEAIPIAERVLSVVKRLWGGEGGDASFAMINLGRLYLDAEDYAKAEPLLLDAVRIQLNHFGPNNPQTAFGFGALGDLYSAMAEYSKAEPLYQKALEISRFIFGSEDLKTASRISDLAVLYLNIREYAKAEPLCQEALKIRQNALEPEDPAVANSVANLAWFYMETGQYAKAEPLYQDALRIRQKVRGPEHIATAYSLSALGELYHHMGDCGKAEAFFQAALKILQKVSKPEHQDMANVYGNLAMVEFDLGRIDEATDFARREAAGRLAVVKKICSFGSEDQRLAYFDLFLPFGIFPELKGAEGDLAAAVLRYKGLVLDSLVEDRQLVAGSERPEDKKRLRQLNRDNTELSQLNLEESLPTRILRVQQLEDEIAKIEGEFAQQSTRSDSRRGALSVTVEQVQSAIPHDGALVEYLQYSRYLGKRTWQQQYGALVLLSEGAPVWIPLGNAGYIDGLVQRYGELVRELLPDDDDLAGNLGTLSDALWTPISRTLPGQIKKLIISPDGQLNFVSFATLLDRNKQFLAQTYGVQYVASGRDLLREPKPATGKEVVLFANPDFDLPLTGTLMIRLTPADFEALNRQIFSSRGSKRKHEPAVSLEVPASSQSDVEAVASTQASGHRKVEGWNFNSLTGTQKEADELAKQFTGWRWIPVTFTGKGATKEAVLKVRSPYILHMATHGFFEEKDPTVTQNEIDLAGNATVTKSKFFRNPMHRNGLALASAQTTIKDWKKDLVPSVENDGILTAEDVSTLDLQGTWLVTLSACDTGSGQARAGEGVMGLRRGFIQAGAQNLLMTLWPIGDEATVDFMGEFYEAAHKTGNAPEALASVQRHWLIKVRGEKGLAQAVALAGPFIMSSQGKP